MTTLKIPEFLNIYGDELQHHDCRYMISAMSSGLNLLNAAKTVQKTESGNSWRTIVINCEMKDGIHYFHFKLDNLSSDKMVIFAIVMTDKFNVNPGNKIGSSNEGFGYGTTGLKYFAGQEPGWGRAVNGNGDEIGMIVDLKYRTLSFSLNGVMIGTAFGPNEIPDGKKWFPAVAIYSTGSTITICKTAEE